MQALQAFVFGEKASMHQFSFQTTKVLKSQAWFFYEWFLQMIFFTKESIRRNDEINDCTKSNRHFGRLPSRNIVIVFENLADGKQSFTLHVGCLSFCVFLSSLFFCVFLSSLSFKKGAFHLFCSPFTSLVECVESFEMWMVVKCLTKPSLNVKIQMTQHFVATTISQTKKV